MHKMESKGYHAITVSMVLNMVRKGGKWRHERSKPQRGRAWATARLTKCGFASVSDILVMLNCKSASIIDFNNIGLVASFVFNL